MKTALEEELGTTLAARARTLSPGVAARLRAIDYHPRQRRRALPIGLAAGAAGAATVGTVLAVALGGAAPAYAGWSATPTSSAPASTAPPDCLSALANASAGSGTGANSGTWQSLLSDVRGPFTITLLQNGTSYATCFTGPSFTEVNRITSSGGAGGSEQSGSLSVTNNAANGAGSTLQGGVGSRVRLEETSSGDLTQVLQNQLMTASNGPYSFIDGRVANGVTGVTLVLDDGQDVVATVADGWFVAWWPNSDASADSAQVTKASGTTSEPFVSLSGVGMKAGPGQPSSPAVPLPGSCTTTTTASTSSGSGNTCKAPSGNSGGGTSKSGNSGNSGSGGNTGITGPGPTTSPKS
jgi:hypothetical protein